MPHISQRARAVPLSPFRKLIPYADAAKAKGRHVYHLNIGQPDIPTPPAALRRLREQHLALLEYSPAVGIWSLREKLAEDYRSVGVRVLPEHVLVTTGASEALQLLFFATMNPGDEVIVPEPFYANYNGFAQIAGVVVKSITCHIENGFQLPAVADFEAKITERTRAICITNPNNPTGCCYDEPTLRELAALAQQHDLYLFVDEVYREFCYDGQEFFSVLRLEELDQHVAVVDSVSKRFSACGARIGNIVTRNEALLNTVTKYAKLRLSPPGLGQLLTEFMLDKEPGYLEAVKREYDRRRRVVYDRLQAMSGVTSYLPGGAFYCFARFPIADAEHFCRWLLEDFEHHNETVMLSPGSGFYATPGLGNDEVRIAYVLHAEALHRAMDCLEAGLITYARSHPHISVPAVTTVS